MYLILIIVLLGILLYMAYRILSSISDLNVISKKLVELKMNSLKTKGGLYPIASQYEMMSLMEENDEIWKRILGRGGPNVPWAWGDREFLSEYIRSGKEWGRLKRDIEESWDNWWETKDRDAVCRQMALSNNDVVFGRKTIEQAEEDIYKARAENDPMRRIFDKGENSIGKAREDYIETVRVTFDEMGRKGNGSSASEED